MFTFTLTVQALIREVSNIELNYRLEDIQFGQPMSHLCAIQVQSLIFLLTFIKIQEELPMETSMKIVCL